MRMTPVVAIVLSMMVGAAHAQYMGNYTANPFLPPAPPQPPGTFTNPYGTSFNSPRLYDGQRNFRGNVNRNPLDPDSIANPLGRYGSPLSPDSTNNLLGAGNPFRSDSPNNPFGTGMPIYGPNR
jgi:hypothetical protein